MLRKIKYLVFFLPFILVAFLLAILLPFTKQKPNSSIEPPIPTPTAIPIKNPFNSITHTLPPVIYSQQAVQKQNSLFTNRQPLSTTDNVVRQTFVAQTTQQNPLIMVTNTFRLEYLYAPDEFQAEILTTDVSQGKKDTVSWLESQGLSFEGICHLPLFFYLSPDVAKTLEGTDITFSPIPDGC